MKERRRNSEGPVFEVRDLCKTYTTGEVEVHALRGVDLEIADGELLVLLGHSGSGKSTLLNILGGLDVATSGTATGFRSESWCTTPRTSSEFPPGVFSAAAGGGLRTRSAMVERRRSRSNSVGATSPLLRLCRVSRRTTG